MNDEDVKDLIADAISDSLEPEWNAHSCAAHILLWLEDAGLCVKAKESATGVAKPGSNEWLMQSPQFHPGDLA